MDDTKKIRDAFEEKDLQEIRVSDSWKIFKIMSEFVQGFEKLAKIGPCVSIFGSARTQPNNIYYQKAEEIAYLLTKKNFGVIRVVVPVLWKPAIKVLNAVEANRLA